MLAPRNHRGAGDRGERLAQHSYQVFRGRECTIRSRADGRPHNKTTYSSRRGVTLVVRRMVESAVSGGRPPVVHNGLSRDWQAFISRRETRIRVVKGGARGAIEFIVVPVN